VILLDIQLAMFEAFAALIFWSCFCRASHTSKANTKRDVRWAFTLLGVVSIVCIVAPFFGYVPDLISIALVGSTAMVQLATSYHWRRGVPVQFRKEP
jgi:hypothetical protein